MASPTFDPGLTQQYTGRLQRAINTDGGFNVRRIGGSWRDAHPYLFLINASWPVFVATVGSVYICVNLIFAFLYLAVGEDSIRGAQAATAGLRFLNVFFFSAHTLTTVGYGNMWPNGPAANLVAAIEALAGLLAFAIATGLVFGRFSRPSSRIGFSQKMIVAPFGDGWSLQFRVVNRRTNDLIELEARVILMTVEAVDGRLQRKFTNLTLERDQILFFPLTWTVVHPITESSPFYNLSAQDVERLQAEVLVMIKGFDETFSQRVNTRYSYRHDEIVWDAKFNPAFEITGEGEMIVDVAKVGDFRQLQATT